MQQTPRSMVIMFVVAGAALAGAAARATVGEKVEAAAKAASGVATKAQNATKRGLKAAASSVEHGAKAAGKATANAAHKIGVPASGPAKRASGH
ncbi:MAG: hypothetical protein HS128_11470 [Ideonella sp.]|nr:hypothetical protein [Ideonella sp.]MCC7458802.1 hypothetical protein [Nitrospira sp.]